MRNSALAAIALCVLSACTKQSTDAVKVINIDIAEAIPVEIDTTSMLRLESSDSALIFGVDRLIHTPGRYIIASRNRLKVYDDTDGSYITDLAHYNAGTSGFSDISHLWHNGDTIKLFDSNKRRITLFLSDGEYLGSCTPIGPNEVHTGQPPRVLHVLEDGKMITINGSTGGSTPDNPLLTLYDAKGQYIKTLPGRQVRESAYLMDGSIYDRDENRLLIWEPLRDTIFTADADNDIRPLYAVDFGENAFPDKYQNIPYMSERMRVFSAGREVPYASVLRYVQPDNGRLYFFFADSERNNYLTRYDETDGSVRILKFASADGRYTPTTFFNLDADTLRIELRDNADMEANPIIYSVAKDYFDK